MMVRTPHFACHNYIVMQKFHVEIEKSYDDLIDVYWILMVSGQWTNTFFTIISYTMLYYHDVFWAHKWQMFRLIGCKYDEATKNSFEKLFFFKWSCFFVIWLIFIINLLSNTWFCRALIFWQLMKKWQYFFTVTMGSSDCIFQSNRFNRMCYWKMSSNQWKKVKVVCQFRAIFSPYSQYSKDASLNQP